MIDFEKKQCGSSYCNSELLDWSEVFYHDGDLKECFMGNQVIRDGVVENAVELTMEEIRWRLEGSTSSTASNAKALQSSDAQLAKEVPKRRRKRKIVLSRYSR